jgi:hypothetical protein
VPGQPLAISVDLARTASGAWSGTITIPSQNLSAFPLSNIVSKDDEISFAMQGVPGDPQFSGRIAGSPRVMSGQFTQGGGSIPFSLAWKGEPKIEAAPKSTKVSSDLEGTWEGAITVGGNQLRLIVKLSNEGDAAKGTMASVDQGGAEFPITQITQSGSTLTLLVAPIRARYEGTFENGQISGTWMQASQSFPLVFKRPSK